MMLSGAFSFLTPKVCCYNRHLNYFSCKDARELITKH